MCLYTSVLQSPEKNPRAEAQRRRAAAGATRWGLLKLGLRAADQLLDRPRGQRQHDLAGEGRILRVRAGNRGNHGRREIRRRTLRRSRLFSSNLERQKLSCDLQHALHVQQDEHSGPPSHSRSAATNRHTDEGIKDNAKSVAGLRHAFATVDFDFLLGVFEDGSSLLQLINYLSGWMDVPVRCKPSVLEPQLKALKPRIIAHSSDQAYLPSKTKAKG